MTFFPPFLLRWWRRLPLAVVGGWLSALAVVAVYWSARHNGFIWDDREYVVDAYALGDPAQWKQALFHPLIGDDVFRPVTLLTLGVQLWAGQTNPAPYHVVSLLLHAANVCLLTVLAWRLFGAAFERPAMGALGATLCGLVYGLHPALSESVLWISARFDLMMTFFLLAALFVDQAPVERDWRRAGLVGGLFLLALLCKETAAGFLGALPLFHLALDPPERFQLSRVVSRLAPHYPVYAAVLLALALYLVFRFTLLGPALGLEQLLLHAGELGSPGQRLLVLLASLSEYISDAFYPHLVPNGVLPVPIVGLARIVPALGLVGGVLVLAGLALRTRVGRAPGFLVLAYLAALLPVANLLPPRTYPGELQIALRYLTFPLAVLCLAGAALMPALARDLAARPRWQLNVGGVLAAAWLVGSVLIVRTTLPHWHDEVIFFRWAIANAPASSWPYQYVNLGAAYYRNGDYTQARDAFTLAIAAKPRTPNLASFTWYRYANFEAKFKHNDEASRAFRNALSLDPDNLHASIELADLERMRNDAVAAVEISEEGLKRLQVSGRTHDDEGWLHYELGLAYAALGRTEDAAAQLMVAQTDRQNPDVRAVASEALGKLRTPGK